MTRENMIKLEFERMQAYIGRDEILATIKGDLVRQDIYQTLYERAIQADYNISAYLSQMRLTGYDNAVLNEEFNQLIAKCQIKFPRREVK